jgi:SAM-dependent methyltransferase
MLRMIKALIRRSLSRGGRVPVLRRGLLGLHQWRFRHHPWMRRHPFDIAYGTQTNLLLPGWLISSGATADAHTTAYAGCQPSCLRAALASIPQLERHAFVDLGCGKGRALIVASEFCFRRVLGVELSPHLVDEARRNVRIVEKRHPHRTAIEIIQGDATGVPIPKGDLVIFLFNPFDRDLVAWTAERLADAAHGTNRVIFLIYECPVHSDVVDAAGFMRWYSNTVPYDADEIDYAPGNGDPVVVWRTGGRKREPSTTQNGMAS